MCLCVNKYPNIPDWAMKLRWDMGYELRRNSMGGRGGEGLGSGREGKMCQGPTETK